MVQIALTLESVKLLIALLIISIADAQSPPTMRTYQDPMARFEFSYPSDFGTPSVGTDNGFRNRTAAIRFSEFSAGVRIGRVILGGEAVLTSGNLQLDIQAAGGLYDEITLGVFPEKTAALIRNALPVLTPALLCDALSRPLHLDAQDPRLSALSAQEKAVLPDADNMGNIAPKVLLCQVSGDTITFDKESSRAVAGPPRHVYGAVRFLPPPYSSFQLIRGTAEAPSQALLDQITAVVNSWKGK